MKLSSSISSFIYKCDFFSTNVGFRFKEERQYASLTGGITSILMILLFIGIFTNTGINTLNKQYIIASQNRKIYEDPSLISLSKEKNFYFMMGLSGIDMNAGIRYFDISMSYRINNNSGNSSQKIRNQVPLVPCNNLSWASFQKQSIQQPVKSLDPQKWLCPLQNNQFELEGKFTSQIFQFVKLSVNKCNPDTDLTRPCATNDQINAYLLKYQSFTLNFYFVNTILNPEQKIFIKYYLEDKNYFPFTLTQGLTANIYVSQYTVKTDESLIPVEDFQENTGGIVKQDTQYFPFHVTGTQYVNLFLRKSNEQILIYRSFRKIDDTLSYIGGLFSSILTFLVILCFYNELSYQLQIANNIYRYDKETRLDINGFHFLNYLVYLFYFVLQLFGLKPNWKKMEQYDKSLIQVRKQMDVRLIFKKILFTEKLAAALLTPEQLTALYLQDNITIKKAEEIRQNYFLPKLLLHQLSGNKKIHLKEQNSSIENQSIYQQTTSKAFSSEIKDQRIAKEMSKANNMVKDDFDNNDLQQSKLSKQNQNNSVSMIKLVGKKSQIQRKLVKIVKKLAVEDSKGNTISKKILNRISPKIKQLLNLYCQQNSNNKDFGPSAWEGSEFDNSNSNQKVIQKMGLQPQAFVRDKGQSIYRTEAQIKKSSALKDQRIRLKGLNHRQKPINTMKINEIKDVIVIGDLFPSQQGNQSNKRKKQFPFTLRDL